LGAVAWSSALESAENATVADDGTIYGVFKDSGEHVLLALSEAGQERWRADLGMAPNPEPVVTNNYPVLAADGTVYIVDRSSKLRAYTPDGALKWIADADARTLHVSGTIPAYPVSVAADGTIFVDSLAAFDATGALRWSSAQGDIGVDEYEVTAIATGQTTLKLAAEDVDQSQLKAFDRVSGMALWATPVGDTRAAAAVLLNQSTFAVPVCSQLNVCDQVSLVDLSTGAVTRTIDSPKPGSDTNQMIVGKDGSLVAFVDVHGDGGIDDPWLWTVAPTGGSQISHLPWNFTMGAVLGDDDVLYVTHNLGVAAVKLDGTVLWNKPSDQLVLGVPAIGHDGCILVRSVPDRKLSCFRSAATGIAQSAWPRSYFGGNHSARR
jgi:hypothetical protein